MTDPKIIAYLKQEIAKRVAKGEDNMAKRMGFGGGFGPNNPDPTVFVFTGALNNKGEVEGHVMEQNFSLASMVYSEHGFMETARKRLAQGDVYAVIKREPNQIKVSEETVSLLLIKKSGCK